ncbi:type II toxin-antitoxin system Phd/YefM family antitoxin [Parabacteroides sp. PF5-6]|uniref:type II toxin-antitoxin system Phd/YefM family antitoxin n=1 Tax=Parabacteroides sp. PF5-6 TaxID=1742403 RepID=UPI002404C5D9|nr:type II toxin-antitoxin system Phd/YefM family antitoxin [Parabacteroides sp. PF5-6]MDF9830871.1 antitoxin YefM [Parabacteroides sp. PF5-6]
MLVISSREFRDNQASYFDRVDNGEEILVQRGKTRSYKIVPIADDDTLMSKEEFFARIDQALQEAREGKVIKTRSKEELTAFLDSL